MQDALSIVYAFWPHAEPPTETEVGLRLAGEEALDGPSGGLPQSGGAPPGVLWEAAWHVRGDDAPTAVFAARSEHLPPGPLLLADPAIERGPWVVAGVTRLGREDPFASFQSQLRTLLRVCPDARGFLDAPSMRVLDPDTARRLTKLPLRIEEVAQIHCVFGTAAREGLWLHSHGVERLGLPDVEMLRVPPSHAEAAGCLLNEFVERYLPCGELPPEGEPVELVFGAPLAWRRVEHEFGPPTSLGGRRDRSRGSHGGRRIALTAPRRGRRGRWGPPMAALRARARDHAILNLHADHVDRMAKRARRCWDEFGMLFVDHRESPDWSFTVNLGLRTPDTDHREDLWFEVLEIRPGRLRGRLLSKPVERLDLATGTEDWYDLGDLVDWRVFGPDTVLRP